MRVVAGAARGRRLAVPAGGATRPTSSRVREAVFNSLHSLGAVEGSSVLDLYAGTGALGIEALSRGAAGAVFVERDRDAVDCLRSNLAATGLLERATVMVSEVEAALAGPSLAGRAFDLAVVDPPYSFDRWAELLGRVTAKIVVAQSDRRIGSSRGWEVRRCKRYGSAVVTFAVPSRAGSCPRQYAQRRGCNPPMH